MPKIIVTAGKNLKIGRNLIHLCLGISSLRTFSLSLKVKVKFDPFILDHHHLFFFSKKNFATYFVPEMVFCYQNCSDLLWHCSNLLYTWETSWNKLKKHSVTKNCSDLSLFFQVISKLLQILDLQPRISKDFLDHWNNFFSQ